MHNLRKWQTECIEKAVNYYSQGNDSFLCVASPGAGKSMFAAELTRRLFELDMIDLVICVGPSIAVCNSLRQTFEQVTERSMCGGFGSTGIVLTYQSLTSYAVKLQKLLSSNRVLLICDEIHHCSYEDNIRANQWGLLLKSLASLPSILKLNLSGTPWRSDKSRIALLNYQGDPSSIDINYLYSLKSAIEDRVCRRPEVVLVDNKKIEVQLKGKSHKFSSIKDAIDSGELGYTDLLYHDKCLDYTIRLGIKRLEEIKRTSPTAAGLIVAQNIAEAERIEHLLSHQFGQYSALVSYDRENSHQIISGFQDLETPWLISVGMVSEGTDIPRLQVCIYLSRIRTELYFRQVLGRVLRINRSHSEIGCLIALAEVNLTEFTERLASEIPEHLRFIRDTAFSDQFIKNWKDDASRIPILREAGDFTNVDIEDVLVSSGLNMTNNNWGGSVSDQIALASDSFRNQIISL